MDAIVYGDFASPECYLAARRADELVAAGMSMDWRAVETRPWLPVGGARLSSEEQDRLSSRFAELEGLLFDGEELPWAMRNFAPKTEAAVSAYAEACGSTVADDVRRLLFALYWREGLDIGSPTVLRTPLAGPILRAEADADPLRESGYAVSVDRGPITTDAYRRIRAWRAEWLALGSPDLPVVLVGGATLSGVEALRRLGKELVSIGADRNPKLGDPRRYPSRGARPPLTWVSQVGGRWRNAYRLSPLS